jgi:acyl carrier protein
MTSSDQLAEIGAEDVRTLLAQLPADFDDDTQLALDSLGLVWLLHLVESRHGLVITPSEELLAGFNTVRGITEHLRRVAREGAGDD